MINVVERRPFSELGDQQLLEQTRRLAANQRCLEVHILDHLDEIDRRGLALRRGFSSLFDYAVRELRFTDAAAQRRIQAMRLCRRHGWVRASLQSGELSMTSAAQLETSHTGHRNVGQGRGRDQDHGSAGRTRQLGLPAAPGEADEQGERGPRSAPDFAPPAGECSGDVAAGNTPAVPMASRAGAQAPGAGHAGAPLPRPELNGNAAPFPAPSCAPVAAPGAGAAAPSSDECPAPLLLPPTDLPASASTPVPEPEPVVAPAESRHTASRAPEPLRDDPFAELSPATVSAAPLLHPQRQRELIEQAAGMSTRQVASLLAAAAPEVLPPRDTLRAVAPDRYTLKVSIDQECEQGLRQLKDLMSHLDPRMSWGDLLARVVREAVTRHDPRGGGSGQRRRRSAGSAGASPRRAPKETRAAGPAQRVGESSGRAPNRTRDVEAAAEPAQRVDESSGRAPNRTRDVEAAAEPAQRVDESSGRAPNKTRATVAPVAPARRRGGATPAPPGDTAATERQNPVAMLANAAPPRQSAPVALLDGARAGGAPSGASAATSAPESALGGSPDRGPSSASAGGVAGASAAGFSARAGVPGAPVATSAPEPALGVPPDGGPSGASAGAAGGASAVGFSARAGVPGSPVASSTPEPALGVFPDGGPPEASAGAAAHPTRDSAHSRPQSPPRLHIPAAVRRHVWLRDAGRCCYRDPLSGRRCTSSHLLQIDHLLPVAQGGGPEPSNLHLLCAAHHRMRHGYGPARPPESPM